MYIPSIISTSTAGLLDTLQSSAVLHRREHGQPVSLIGRSDSPFISHQPLAPEPSPPSSSEWAIVTPSFVEMRSTLDLTFLPIKSSSKEAASMESTFLSIKSSSKEAASTASKTVNSVSASTSRSTPTPSSIKASPPMFTSSQPISTSTSVIQTSTPSPTTTISIPTATSSSPTESTTSPSPESPLSPANAKAIGIKLGIALGTIFAVILVLLLVYWLHARRRGINVCSCFGGSSSRKGKKPSNQPLPERPVEMYPMSGIGAAPRIDGGGRVFETVGPGVGVQRPVRLAVEERAGRLKRKSYLKRGSLSRISEGEQF